MARVHSKRGATRPSPIGRVGGRRPRLYSPTRQPSRRTRHPPLRPRSRRRRRRSRRRASQTTRSPSRTRRTVRARRPIAQVSRLGRIPNQDRHPGPYSRLSPRGIGPPRRAIDPRGSPPVTPPRWPASDASAQPRGRSSAGIYPAGVRTKTAPRQRAIQRASVPRSIEVNRVSPARRPRGHRASTSPDPRRPPRSSTSPIGRATPPKSRPIFPRKPPSRRISRRDGTGTPSRPSSRAPPPRTAYHDPRRRATSPRVTHVSYHCEAPVIHSRRRRRENKQPDPRGTPHETWPIWAARTSPSQPP